MADDSDFRRDEIDAKLRELGPQFDRPAVLVGWCIVTDWSDNEGDRWVSKAHSASIPRWHVDGLHHEALYGQWPEEAEEEHGDEL